MQVAVTSKQPLLAASVAAADSWRLNCNSAGLVALLPVGACGWCQALVSHRPRCGPATCSCAGFGSARRGT
jgi:hypothetical protein